MKKLIVTLALVTAACAPATTPAPGASPTTAPTPTVPPTASPTAPAATATPAAAVPLAGRWGYAPATRPDPTAITLTIAEADGAWTATETSSAAEARLTGAKVDDGYEFTGTYTPKEGAAQPMKLSLWYDPDRGRWGGRRLIGADVSEGGRGALPIELYAAR